MLLSAKNRYFAMISRPPATSRTSMITGIQFGGISGFFSAFGVYLEDAGTAELELLDAARSFGCVPFGVTRPPPDFRFGGAIGG
jgi:hypothetical protein